YRGDGIQQGEGVGVADCSDKELETVYAVGALHPATTGDDIVLWVVIRAHHEPRFNGEEANFLPYHYEEFSIVPRSFAEWRHQGPGGHCRIRDSGGSLVSLRRAISCGLHLLKRTLCPNPGRRRAETAVGVVHSRHQRQNDDGHRPTHAGGE